MSNMTDLWISGVFFQALNTLTFIFGRCSAGTPLGELKTLAQTPNPWDDVLKTPVFIMQSMLRSIRLGNSYLCVPVTTVFTRAALRSAARGDLVIPRTRRRLGNRAFCVAGPTFELLLL